MDRRKFLKLFPGLGLLLFDAKTAIARTFFQSREPEFAESLYVYPAGDDSRVSIPILWQNEIPYISAADLSEAFKYRTYFNEEKRKLVIYLPQNKIVLSSDNPFVIIDNKTLQMPIYTRWEDGMIFIPVPYLVPLINRYTNLSLDYDPQALILRVAEKGYNVAGVDIETRNNGIVIRIRTSQTFRQGEISMDMRFEWLHIDLYGASADTTLIDRTPLKSYIYGIKGHQFPELLSIGFRLSKEPIAKEVYQDDETGEVLVILRYAEEVAQKDIDNSQPVPDDSEEIRDQLAAERKRWMIDTIVIDPGHGGKDPGAIGIGKIREKDIVLSVAQKVGSLIQKKMPGVKVVFTRDDDRFIPLRRRTEIANESQAKLFVSIHANANRSTRAHGFETYILGLEKGDQARNVVERENAVIRFEDKENQQHYEGINKILATMLQSSNLKQSEHLAAEVQDEMHKRLRSLDMRNRGVKQAPFWVMVGATMPSILVETGFITNRRDAKILKTRSHQQKIAEGIFAGLSQFKKDYESAI